VDVILECIVRDDFALTWSMHSKSEVIQCRSLDRNLLMKRKSNSHLVGKAGIPDNQLRIPTLPSTWVKHLLT